MLSFTDFVNLLNNVWVSNQSDGLSSPNNINPQCFDVAQLWSKALGGQPFTGATADLIFNQTQNGFYTQIANTLTNYPQRGDIVVFDWPHVGICTGNNTNVVSVELLEQNDPDGSPVHIQLYNNYDGVIGWLRLTK